MKLGKAVKVWRFNTGFFFLMDKNNRKLKILYKCIMLIPVQHNYDSIPCTYHQLQYSSPDHSNPSTTTKKKEKKKNHTKELSFWKMGVMGEIGQENGPKIKKGATGLGTREEI